MTSYILKYTLILIVNNKLLKKVFYTILSAIHVLSAIGFGEQQKLYNLLVIKINLELSFNFNVNFMPNKVK